MFILPQKPIYTIHYRFPFLYVGAVIFANAIFMAYKINEGLEPDPRWQPRQALTFADFDLQRFC